jgi:hypothetical protein
VSGGLKQIVVELGGDAVPEFGRWTYETVADRD